MMRMLQKSTPWKLASSLVIGGKLSSFRCHRVGKVGGRVRKPGKSVVTLILVNGKLLKWQCTMCDKCVGHRHNQLPRPGPLRFTEDEEEFRFWRFRVCLGCCHCRCTLRCKWSSKIPLGPSAPTDKRVPECACVCVFECSGVSWILAGGVLKNVLRILVHMSLKS